MPVLLALLMIGFWGCGVKTMPKSDALELLPEIPFHPVPEKGTPTEKGTLQRGVPNESPLIKEDNTDDEST